MSQMQSLFGLLVLCGTGTPQSVSTSGYDSTDPEIEVLFPTGDFPFSTASTQSMRPTQPHIHWFPLILFPDAKPPDRETDHSPASNAEVKNP
jgi:hypothetical protein